MRIALVCLILCLLLSGGIRAEWDVQRLRKEISASEQSLQDSKSEFVQEYLEEAQRCYYLRDFNASITAIRKGLYLDPQNQDLLVLWGANLIELGAYDKAERVLKRLVSLYPKCYAGWRYLYQCYVKTSDLNGQKMVLKKLYALAKSDEERNGYFKQLVDILQRFPQREDIDTIRNLIINRLKVLCNIDVKEKVDVRTISEVEKILNQIEDLKKNIPDVRDYYADFMSELYNTMHLFDLGYKAIASERLRDLLSQKCPALSS